MIYDSSSISPSSGAGSPASFIIFLIFSFPFSLLFGGSRLFWPATVAFTRTSRRRQASVGFEILPNLT
jgi:hypothetical protein